jgi:hypothetical protein
MPSRPLARRLDKALLGKARHDRVFADFYGTVDGRCVEHLGRVFPLGGQAFVEPCAGQGHLVWQLEQHGAVLHRATDLYAHPERDPRIETGIDVFEDPPTGSEMIVTNPPFDRLHAVTECLLQAAPEATLVLLTRASQVHVKAMRRLFDHRFLAFVPLPFRPRWFSTGPTTGPRHEYGWLIWRPASQLSPVTMQPRLLLW